MQDQLGVGAAHGEVFIVEVLVIEEDQCERVGGGERLRARLEADGVGRRRATQCAGR